MKWFISNFFGNKDDGIYGPPGYLPPKWLIAVCWWFRNPAHNFTFYVIGLAAIPTTEYTRTGRFPYTNFNPYEGWNWTVIRYKSWWLPFISYQDDHLGQFYIGWRDRGAFGIKLNGLLLVAVVCFSFYIAVKGL